MLKNFKLIIILLVISGIAFILGLSYYESHKLVKNFEENVEKKEFHPEASALEISEIDAKSPRGWKIKTKKGLANKEMTLITAEGVEAQIFDDQDSDKIKILVQSPHAVVEKNTGKAVLTPRADITMVEKNIKIQSDKFILQKGVPMEAIGNVIVLLKPDGSQQINAQKGVISADMNDIVFYNVSPSKVSDNLTIKGGILKLKQANSKTEKITLSNGAWVQNDDLTCQSSLLEVFMDGNGNAETAIFYGSPVVVNQKGKILKASKVIYNMKNGSVQAVGGVKINSF